MICGELNMRPAEVEALPFSKLVRYGRMAVIRNAERIALAGGKVTDKDLQEMLEEYLYGTDVSVARRIRKFGEEQRAKTRR